MKDNSPTKKFIIKYSGGLIQNQSQAMLVIVLIFIMSLIYSLFILYRTFNPQRTTEVIYPEPEVMEENN
jgi:hypothetical protein